MTDRISAAGLKRRYKPVNDEGNPDRDKNDCIILLETRGSQGSMMDLIERPGSYAGVSVAIPTVRVLAKRKKKAIALARANDFKFREFDGEAEIFIPCSRADEYLHGLGAKVRKSVSPSVIAAFRKRRAAETPEQVKARIAKAKATKAAKKAGLATPL